MRTGSVMHPVHPKVPSEAEATIAPVMLACGDPAPINRPSRDRQVRLTLTPGRCTILQNGSVNRSICRSIFPEIQNATVANYDYGGLFSEAGPTITVKLFA
jgi:hypothetical protein